MGDLTILGKEGILSSLSLEVSKLILEQESGLLHTAQLVLLWQQDLKSGLVLF
jgi:hypothetical protein